MSMMYVRNLVDLHLKYYTDWHDVDEEFKTITDYGGYWLEQSMVGVMDRNMYDPTTTSASNVAYKYNKNSTPVMRVEFYMNCLNLWICQITKEQRVIVFIIH